MCRYQCHECDRQFDKPDFVTETHGFELPPYEKMAVCPYCKGYFEEMYQCKVCKEFFTDDELTSGVCDCCIWDKATDFEFCYKLGNEEDAKETIKLNGLVASIFTEEQIAEILMKELRIIKDIGLVNCFEFIGSDKSWFAEQLIKEKQNAEKF